MYNKKKLNECNSVMNGIHYKNIKKDAIRLTWHVAY